MLTASFHLIDTAMVVKIGDIPTAAIGIAGRWFFLIYLTYFGFGSGMAVIVSQFWGIKDIKTIRKSFGIGYINVFVVSIVAAVLAYLFTPQFIRVFTSDPLLIAEGVRYLKIACWSFIPLGVALSFSYLLRSTEIVILPLITTVISVALNTVLNYLLIFGNFGFPMMGIQGAAIATVISTTVQMILLVSICYIKKNVAAAKIKELFSFTKEFAKKYYVLALPVLANEVLWALGVNAYNMILARQGSANYAAYTIYGSIEQISFTFFIGLCSACAVIVGKTVGTGDLNRAYSTAKKFLVGVPLFSIVLGILVILLRSPLIGLFNVSNQYTSDMVNRLLLIYGIILPILILPYIAIVGIFRAGGDTRTGLIYDVINVWFIGVPIVALCGLYFKLPFEWIFVSMWSEHVVKTILCIRYFKTRKWLRVLTHNNMANI
ncbi:MAG: MATE family efflux transporter [Clostridiales bacterium]|nr:MATE family efflux transporter [Clostridiales bacterium]